jgi:hypothetical protein
LNTSPPAQFSEIEEKLRAAWFFLSGEFRCFRFCEGMNLQDEKDVYRRIVLPISLHNVHHLAAIVLLIDREDAEKLATSMFAISKTDLTDADIADACVEACNVLSGAIIGYLNAHDQVEIGIPKAIGSDGYQLLLNGSEIKACSDGNSDNHHLMLVIFDPLVEPKYTESD